MPTETSSESIIAPTGRAEFAHRVWVAVLIVAAAAGAVVLLWLASPVVLLLFAGILLAIFFRTLSDWIARKTGLSALASLTITIAGLVVLAGSVGWLLAAPVSQEIAALSDELPQAAARLELQLSSQPWGAQLVRMLRQPAGALEQVGRLLADARTFFAVTIRGIVYVWVFLFCGLYLATQPEFYIRGFLTLVPPTKQPRAEQLLHRLGHELRGWLFGQIFSMTIIGVLTWGGLRLLGIPLAEGLGVLSGVLDFVPIVGPWIAGILACLLALLKSPIHSVYVASLFIGLHLFEGHVLVPQVQKHATRLPPVLTILAMLLFEELFGFLGLFLATPLLVLVMVCAKELYVHDLLGERSGETGARR